MILPQSLAILVVSSTDCAILSQSLAILSQYLSGDLRRSTPRLLSQHLAVLRRKYRRRYLALLSQDLADCGMRASILGTDVTLRARCVANLSIPPGAA